MLTLASLRMSVANEAIQTTDCRDSADPEVRVFQQDFDTVIVLDLREHFAYEPSDEFRVAAHGRRVVAKDIHAEIFEVALRGFDVIPNFRGGLPRDTGENASAFEILCDVLRGDVFRNAFVPELPASGAETFDTAAELDVHAGELRRERGELSAVKIMRFEP